MENEIDVSFVMTVYNKEYYLPSVLKALLNQTGVKNPEYIFADDVSSDRSVEIIREMTKGLKNVKIFANTENRGISVRTNQGINAATGKYIRLLDSDDILPLDSTQKMMELAEELDADMIYGNFIKTGKEPQELEHEFLSGDFTYDYNKDALRTVLTGRYTRMGQLIKTDVLKKGDGADERVFIQDESLPLRAALHAHGIVKIHDNVVLVPKELGNFSGNKIQLDNDRFMAYCYTLQDNPHLPADIQKMMYMRALSAFWKYTRKTALLPYLTPVFFKYLAAKINPPMPDMTYLKKMQEAFLKLPDIRRIKN